MRCLLHFGYCTKSLHGMCWGLVKQGTKNACQMVIEYHRKYTSVCGLLRLKTSFCDFFLRLSVKVCEGFCMHALPLLCCSVFSPFSSHQGGTASHWLEHLGMCMCTLRSGSGGCTWKVGLKTAHHWGRDALDSFSSTSLLIFWMKEMTECLLQMILN